MAVAVELLVRFVRFVPVEVSKDDAGREREPVTLATFRPTAGGILHHSGAPEDIHHKAYSAEEHDRDVIADVALHVGIRCEYVYAWLDFDACEGRAAVLGERQKHCVRTERMPIDYSQTRRASTHQG